VLAGLVAVALVIAGLATIYGNARAAGTHDAVARQESSITFARGYLARLVTAAQTVDHQLTSITTPAPATIPTGLALTLTNSELALASTIASAQHTPDTIPAADRQISAVNAAVASAGVALAQIGPEYSTAVAQAIAAAPLGNASLVKALDQGMAVLAASAKNQQGIRSAIDVVTSRMQALATAQQTASARVSRTASLG
jgi:hypothetical protein